MHRSSHPARYGRTDSRVLVGLAPRDGGRRTAKATYEEIGRIFAGQQAASDEIREVASRAVAVDVLAVRGLGLRALNDSLLWPALSQSARRVRVFLLDPDCPAAGLRAGGDRGGPGGVCQRYPAGG